MPRDWTEREPAILISRCGACGFVWYLRRDSCPGCGSGKVQRVPSKGTGAVTARTAVHRVITGGTSSDDPIGIALVQLDEGAHAMGRCAPETHVGERVRATFVAVADSGPMPSLVPFFERVT